MLLIFFYGKEYIDLTHNSKKGLYREIFVLSDLPIYQKQKILNRFFSIHQQIFTNVDYQTYRKQILETRAENITLHMFKNKQGKDVGFCILYRYRMLMDKNSIIVFRSDAGLLTKYRHKLSTLSFGLLYVLRYKLLHPFENMIYCESFVHPSSYHLLYKYYPLVYPSPDKNMPKNISVLLKTLRQYFQFKPALSGSNLCAYSGWVTIDSDPDLMEKKKLQYPDVAYFHEKNPKFKEGDGLIVLIPVKIIYIVKSLFTLTIARLSK